MVRIRKYIPDVEKIVFISDTHHPFHDPIAISLVLSFIRWFEPDYIYLAGDIIDFYSLSRYHKNPERANRLQEELDITIDFLSRIRAAAPHAIIKYRDGNHEDRLITFLMQNPQIYSLRALTLTQMLELDKFDIEHFGYKELLQHGDFLVEHGDMVRPASSYTAKGMFEKRLMSGISGHTHRMGVHYRTTASGSFQWNENGCLCKTNPEYVNGVPNWQQGFTVGHFLKDEGRMVLDPIPIRSGRLFYNGLLFEADENGKYREELEEVLFNE